MKQTTIKQSTMKIKLTKNAALAALGICLVTTVTSNAAVITGTTAFTSSGWAGTEGIGANLVDAADLTGDQHAASVFNGGTNWLSADVTTDQQWVFIDLGNNYDLNSVDLWNYGTSSLGDQDVNGRGVDGFELFVGAAGATIPVGASATAFSGAGWTSVSSNILAPTGLASHLTAPGDLYDGQSFAVTNSNVRYVGIQIKTRLGAPTPYTVAAVGLGQVRVNAVPEPSSTALLGLGGLTLILRRRK